MKLLFLTTEDSTFWSHRLALARKLRDQGVEVVIMIRSGEFRSRLEEEGFRVIPWNISRKSLNPFREFRSFCEVWKSYRGERPDIVHQIALKPIVYGCLAARLCGGMPSVSTVTGLGPVFIRTNLMNGVLRSVLVKVLRLCFGAESSRVIFQNRDDRELFVTTKIAGAAVTSVVPGFGVNTEQFAPRPEPAGEFVVMLPARLLWEKGVREFVDAARVLRRSGAAVRMVLVGAPDPNNPGCIPERQIREWAGSGDVEWWGHQEDMPGALERSHLVCLPSYREGLPKVLLEAGACGRAVVTTDVTGCREVVRNEVNGLLVPPRNSVALAAAIRRLLEDSKLRRRLAAEGRLRVEREFSSQVILGKMLDLYGEILGGKWPARPATGERASKAAARVLSEV